MFTGVFSLGGEVSADTTIPDVPKISFTSSGRVETFYYNENNLKTMQIEANSLVLTFSDETKISIDDYNPNYFDSSHFEFNVQESYSLITPRAGGNINFPNKVTVSKTTYGTSSYPPGQINATATRRKAYQERIYEATYSGKILLSSIQGGTGGGKTYVYSGSIPYISHRQV